MASLQNLMGGSGDNDKLSSSLGQDRHPRSGPRTDLLGFKRSFNQLEFSEGTTLMSSMSKTGLDQSDHHGGTVTPDDKARVRGSSLECGE